MKRLLVCSIVRDGMKYLPLYFHNLKSIAEKLDIIIDVCICEGDSTDNTYDYLLNMATNCTWLRVFKYDHKGKKYGSVNVAERWKNIAKTWNYMLDQIKDDLHVYNGCMYLESDLYIDENTVKLLLDDLDTYDAVAPLSLAMEEDRFYDTWGHRAFGVNFVFVYPYHKLYTTYGRFFPLESAGSCIMMRPEVLKICRVAEHDAMIGHDIIKYNFSFVLDKETNVYHP